MVMLTNMKVVRKEYSVNNPFTRHPHSVGETYLQHMKKAMKYGLRIQLVSLMIFIHATFPFLFEHDASDEIEKINKELQNRR